MSELPLLSFLQDVVQDSSEKGSTEVGGLLCCVSYLRYPHVMFGFLFVFLALVFSILTFFVQLSRSFKYLVFFYVHLLGV